MDEIPSSPVEPENGNENSLRALLIDMGVKELKALSELQAKGWKDERVDEHFKNQRDKADNAGDDLRRRWFKKMKEIMREIDKNAKCIQDAGNMQFLDLGCCPCGFTSYILDKNPEAIGYGISLEVAKGGHSFLLEKHHQSRFGLIFADLTYFQLGPSMIHDPQFRPLPPQIEPRSCGLVVLDGHRLRTQEGARMWECDRLLISQFILGLEAVKHGGTIVVKLSRPDSACTAKLLYMLDMVCGRLTTFKPRTMHNTRGTFYAIAKNAGLGVDAERLPATIEGLKKLWFELTFSGENGFGRWMLETDLDFVISTEELIDRYLARLIKLARHVWLGQAKALHGFLRKKGVAVDDVVLPVAHK